MWSDLLLFPPCNYCSVQQHKQNIWDWLTHVPLWHDIYDLRVMSQDPLLPLKLLTGEKRCKATSSACHESPNDTFNIIQNLNIQCFRFRSSDLLKSVTINRSGEEGRRTWREKKRNSCFLLAVTPPPLNLLCVRVRVRLHVRRDGRRQMACHPVLCSLGDADMFPHQLLFRRAALTREVPGDEHGGQDGALRIKNNILVSNVEVITHVP